MPFSIFDSMPSEMSVASEIGDGDAELLAERPHLAADRHLEHFFAGVANRMRVLRQRRPDGLAVRRDLWQRLGLCAGRAGQPWNRNLVRHVAPRTLRIYFTLGEHVRCRYSSAAVSASRLRSHERIP